MCNNTSRTLFGYYLPSPITLLCRSYACIKDYSPHIFIHYENFYDCSDLGSNLRSDRVNLYANLFFKYLNPLGNTHRFSNVSSKESILPRQLIFSQQNILLTSNLPARQSSIDIVIFSRFRKLTHLICQQSLPHNQNPFLLLLLSKAPMQF